MTTKKPAQVTAAPRLTAASILAAEDLKRETVRVPEWGGTVNVRGLTGAERDDFEVEMSKSKAAGKNIRATLAVRCLCDDEGNRIFTDAQGEALGRKSASALDRVFAVASRLSGIGTKDIDELEKN